MLPRNWMTVSSELVFLSVKMYKKMSFSHLMWKRWKLCWSQTRRNLQRRWKRKKRKKRRKIHMSLLCRCTRGLLLCSKSSVKGQQSVICSIRSSKARWGYKSKLYRKTPSQNLASGLRSRIRICGRELSAKEEVRETHYCLQWHLSRLQT